MESITHIYIDNKLVGLGNCKIEVKQEKPTYNICIIRDEDVDCPLPHYATMYLNYKGHGYSKHRMSELIEELGKVPENIDTFINTLNKKETYYVVYAHVHSGISLSLAPFNNKFDSGIYGIIKINENNREPIENIIKDLENWINGNSYVINIVDELNEDVECLYNVFANNPEDIKLALKENDLYDEYGITMEKIQSAWNIV